MKQFQIPVAIFIYKRPKQTASLMSVIQQIKPKELWVIADGAKNNQERFSVYATRNQVEKNITWDCDVHKIYAENNLGLKQRVITGLNSVFQKVDRAIILEDDCLPNKDFFQFCDEMLAKYQADPKVLSISGGNYLFENQSEVVASYYFSKYFHVWGWATWKRAWQLYDPDLKHVSKTTLQTLKSKFLNTTNHKKKRNPAIAGHNAVAFWYWQTMIQKIKAGKLTDTWDYQWTITHLLQGGTSIIPARNLVTNQGFGQDATHTKFKHRLSSLSLEHLAFPLNHPQNTQISKHLDILQEKQSYLTIRSILGLLFK